MKWGLKVGFQFMLILGLLGISTTKYVLWCCGGICHQVFTFIQIGSGAPYCVKGANFLVANFVGVYDISALKVWNLLAFDHCRPRLHDYPIIGQDRLLCSTLVWSSKVKSEYQS